MASCISVRPNIMKTFVTFCFLFSCVLMKAQKSDFHPNMSDNGLLKMTHDYFVSNNLSNASCYSYKIDKSGKLTGDSIILYDQKFDKQNLKLSGFNCKESWKSEKNTESTWFKFESHYNNKGNKIRYYQESIGSDKKMVLDKLTKKSEMLYEYDSNDNLVKRVTKEYAFRPEMSSNKIDSIWLETVFLDIDEHEFATNGELAKRYHTVDTLKYVHNGNPVNKYCYNCRPRYLMIEWFYDNNGLEIEWDFYRAAGFKNVKRNLFYNSDKKIVKSIDSSGFNSIVGQPVCESITTYEYSDTGYTKTEVSVTQGAWGTGIPKLVKYYNLDNDLIMECQYDESNNSSCKRIVHRKKDNKITEIQTVDDKGNLHTVFYQYKGQLLMEHKETYNGTLSLLIRYFYE